MLIIVEFPSREQATIWYGSPEYASALEVRGIALSPNLILVDPSILWWTWVKESTPNVEVRFGAVTRIQTDPLPESFEISRKSLSFG